MNKKFRRLALEVGGNAIARGHLELLWDSAYESGDEIVGDVVDVELAADWKGSSGSLAKAMTNAGFLDESGGIYTVHDFWHHAPDYVASRRSREVLRKKARPCDHCGGVFHSADAKSKYCTPACRTAAYRDRHSDAGVTDGIVTVTNKNEPVTDCDTTPSPSPSPLNKRIPPTKVGLSELETTWLTRMREGYPEKQPDGTAAPYSAPGSLIKPFKRTLKENKITPEELAWCVHLYIQRMLGSKRYVKALATVLGPQKVWEPELDEARAMIASQQVSA